jgi:hypothetical protein
MANGIINLILKSAAVGSGFDDVRKQTSELIAGTTDLSKAAKSLGRVFGDVGNLAGQVFGNLLEGGIWSVAAAGVKFLVGKWKEHKEAVEKSLEAERKAFDERVAKIEQYTQAMKRADETVSRANSRIDALRAEREEIARSIKANNELERQRRIAAGEDVETVNADIDSRNASNDQSEKASAAADMRKKAENDLSAAREKAKLGEDAVNKLLADRAKLISDIHKRAQALWADEHKFAARAGYRLKESEEKSYMSRHHDKDYDEKLKQLANLEKKIAETKDDQVKASDALANAATKHAAALERVKAVEAENHAAALKAANERAAAEKAAEDARLEAVAKNLEEARAKAEKESQDAADREADYQRMLQAQAEKEALDAEREANKKKLDNIKKEHQAKMEALEKEIRKAHDEARVLEANAQRARGGKTFGEWDRGERDIARKQRRADIRQQNVIKNAQSELSRLEANARRGRAFTNAHDRARMARLREFLADQDPANNPALKRAAELEKQRKQAEEKMQQDVGAILGWLKNNGGL